MALTGRVPGLAFFLPHSLLPASFDPLTMADFQMRFPKQAALSHTGRCANVAAQGSTVGFEA
jgi:hypothetical protein